MAKDIGKQSNSPRDWFGQSLVKLADEFNFLVVDCDVAGGTGAWHFREAYPDRFIQCGIAEQAATGIACGLATAQPVIFTTFAVFGARAWEILRLQAFYNNLPVIVALSHLGIDVGPDGASAQSLEHYALWRSLPGDNPIIHPCCPNEMEEALKWMLERNGPGVLFTGRSEVELGEWANKVKFSDKPFLVHKGKNAKALILSTGHTISNCIKAAGDKADVYSIARLDGIGILSDGIPNAREYKGCIIVEDHGSIGGLGDMVKNDIAPFRHLCIENWGQSGNPDELASYHNISVEAIRQAIDKS